jgi:hypothetical protein
VLFVSDEPRNSGTYFVHESGQHSVGGTGVTNPGDFVLTHVVPPALNVNGLIANWSIHIT